MVVVGDEVDCCSYSGGCIHVECLALVDVDIALGWGRRS